MDQPLIEKEFYLSKDRTNQNNEKEKGRSAIYQVSDFHH